MIIINNLVFLISKKKKKNLFIVKANIGIIMGNNSSLTRTCEKFGIEINEGLGKMQPNDNDNCDDAMISNKKLYRVQGWKEIHDSNLLEF
jgi:hypothetical protein